MTRAALAALAGLMGFVLPSTAVASDAFRVPGWRTPYANSTIAPLSHDQGVRIESRRGLSGLDQFVEAPNGEFTIAVDGEFASGSVHLVVEQFDASTKRIAADEAPLGPANHAVRRFAAAPAAENVRVLLVQRTSGESLALRTVRMASGRNQILQNPGLDLAGCVRGAAPTVPLGEVRVRNWRLRYAGTLTQVQRRGGLSPMIAVSSKDGLAGLDQAVPMRPGAELIVRVRGRFPSRAAFLHVEWKAGGSSGDPYRGTPIQVRDRRLGPGRGESVHRLRAPAADGPLTAIVAVLSLRASIPFFVTEVRALSQGNQLLTNPTLDTPLCPAAPTRPGPAGTLPRLFRWLLTIGAVLATGLALVMACNSHRGQAEGVGPTRPSLLQRRVFLLAVVLLPLVSVGTVKVGLRLIASDWLLLGVAVAVVATSRRVIGRMSREAALAVLAAVGIAAVGALAIAYGLIAVTPPNLDHLATAERLRTALGAPSERAGVDELRLIQGVAALFVTAAITTAGRVWSAAAAAFVVGALVATTYGLYQVLGTVVFDSVPQLPGSFPYPELQRASATFPEPTAYAGFAVVAAALAAVLMQRSRGWKAPAALALLVVGVLLSRSTVGALGLAALVLVLLVLRFYRPTALVATIVLTAVAIMLVAGSASTIEATLVKPLSGNNSVLDREATWQAAASMGGTYAPIGVGRGLFPYNVGPFLAPEDVFRGGRTQSAALEIWAETGPVGAMLMLAIVGAIGAALVRRRPSPEGWVLLIPLLVVFSLYYTSSFAWIWVAFGLALSAAFIGHEGV